MIYDGVASNSNITFDDFKEKVYYFGYKTSRMRKQYMSKNNSRKNNHHKMNNNNTTKQHHAL
jgi:hypothetical protein